MTQKTGEQYVYSPEKRRFDVIAARTLIPIEMAFRTLSMTQGTAGRPLILEQERLGVAAQPFMAFKMRTLNEDGITPISPLMQLFRQNGIDELPQVWNILHGDMSLVGRRPLIPVEYHRQYEAVGHDTAGARLVDKHRSTAGIAKPGILSTHAIQGHRGNESVMTLASRLELDVFDFEHASHAHSMKLIKTLVNSLRHAELQHGDIRIRDTGIATSED